MEAERLDPDGGTHERLLVVLSYLGPLALVSLIAARREFVKWHAKQGLVLFAVAWVVYPVLRFCGWVIDRLLFRVFSELYDAFLALAVLGFVIALLVSIVRGLEGERFKLPLIGDLADRL